MPTPAPPTPCSIDELDRRGADELHDLQRGMALHAL